MSKRKLCLTLLYFELKSSLHDFDAEQTDGRAYNSYRAMRAIAFVSRVRSRKLNMLLLDRPIKEWVPVMLDHVEETSLTKGIP